MKSKEDRWRRYWISSSHPSLLGANSERDAFPPQSVWERVRENEKRLVDQPYNLRGSVERALQAGRGKHPPLLDQSLSRRFQFSLAEQPTWAITYHFGDDHCLFSQTFLSICLKSESCMMKKEETRNIFCHSASNISKKNHCPFNAPFILSKIVHLFQAFPLLTQNPEKLLKVFLGNVPPSFPLLSSAS